MDYRIKDISLAGFGRMEIDLAETEMPGLIALREKYSENRQGQKKVRQGQRHKTFHAQ